MAVPLRSARPRIGGILCTYRRAQMALRYLDVLDRQDVRPDIVVVVDNSSDEQLRRALAARRGTFEVLYLDPGSNLGPAGAFEVGVRELAERLAPNDLVVHFDDDDPPVDPGQLAALVDALDRARQSDSSVGGIGMSGGRLDTRSGTVRSVDGTAPLEEVDHLHGGYLPIYVFAALRDVGGNDPTFFYGFEELELGRRLHQRGWKLLVDNELMDSLRDRYPKRVVPERSRFAVDEHDLGWSRFHKERNLVRILRRERRWVALVANVVSRGVLKPLLRLPLQPRAAAKRLLLGVRAAIAGVRDQGGIDRRYPPA